MEADGRLWLLAVAILLDALVGDPPWLWSRLPHPAALIGRGVGWLDRTFNRADRPPEARRTAGLLAAAAIALAALAAGALLAAAFAALPFGWLLELAAVVVLLAGRSLHDHVGRVAEALETGGLSAGREAVRRIVGRDPASLDAAGVARAAIESLAENFADGVVAPAFWYALLGLPGLLACKAINTADSMIGHRTPRHLDFGRAAARLDDAVNWLPARLAGGLLALAAAPAGGDPGAATAAMRADAGRHRSVNAGWPEAAMAGALGLALAGPRRYAGETVDDPYMNAAGRSAATPADIRAALKVHVTANVLLLALVSLTAMAL